MAKTRRVISDDHLAKLQAAAKAARTARAKAGKTCGDCGAKVKPRGDNEPYVRSSTRPGVIYCWPGTGCWIKATGQTRSRADL